MAAGLGDFRGARDAYLDAAANFQASKGINTSANNQRRADGYAFAASNAALALAQLGNLPAAREELRKVSRRAAGNADARGGRSPRCIGLRGGARDAEREWEFACDRISVGCAKYRDEGMARERSKVAAEDGPPHGRFSARAMSSARGRETKV